MAGILKKVFSGKSTGFLNGVQRFMEAPPSIPQDCNEKVMTGIYTSMKEVLAVPGFLTRSYDQVQALLHLLQHLSLYDQHQDGLHNLLEHGLTNMVLITSLHSVRGRAGEANDKFFEDVMETIVGVGDYSTRAKVAMTETFCDRLLQIITSESFRFATRMEALKSINLLLERCPLMVRDRLKEHTYHLELLRNMGQLIETVGDYEFQVGIVECLFRLVGKSHRENLGEDMFASPQHLRAFLQIRDTEFETDCRSFLNKINSEPKKNSCVHSYPCLSVHLGSFQLRKPEDETYSEFWVDFNTGSQRITLFCNQENPDLQDEEESMWETVSIWKDNVIHYALQETADIVQVCIRLNGAAQDLVTFGPSSISNERTVMILFDARFNLPPALKQTFGAEKCKAVSMKKVSQVQQPITIKLDEYDYEQDIALEADLRSLSSGMRGNLTTPKLGSVNRNDGSNTPRMKVSVPCQPMQTPTYMCTPTPPSPAHVEVEPSNNAPESGHTPSPKTPKSSTASVKRVKTPLNIVGGMEKKESMKYNTGKAAPRRSSRQKTSHASAIVLPALENAEEDISVEMKSKQKFPAVTPDNSVPHPVKASKAMPHNEQEIIPSSCPEEHCINIPESQPLPLYGPLPTVSHNESSKMGVRSQISAEEPESLDITTSDSSSQDKVQRRKDIQDMKAKIAETDPQYTSVPLNFQKASHTPCLSTVDEEMMSNHSSSVGKAAGQITPVTVEHVDTAIQSSPAETGSVPGDIDVKCVQMSPDSTSGNCTSDKLKPSKQVNKNTKGKRKTKEQSVTKTHPKRVTRSCKRIEDLTDEQPEKEMDESTKRNGKKAARNKQQNSLANDSDIGSRPAMVDKKGKSKKCKTKANSADNHLNDADYENNQNASNLQSKVFEDTCTLDEGDGLEDKCTLDQEYDARPKIPGSNTCKANDQFQPTGAIATCLETSKSCNNLEVKKTRSQRNMSNRADEFESKNDGISVEQAETGHAGYNLPTQIIPNKSKLPSSNDKSVTCDDRENVGEDKTSVKNKKTKISPQNARNVPSPECIVVLENIETINLLQPKKFSRDLSDSSQTKPVVISETPLEASQELEVPNSISSENSEITCAQIPPDHDSQEKMGRTKLRSRPIDCSPLSGMEFIPNDSFSVDSETDKASTSSNNSSPDEAKADKSQKLAKKKVAQKPSDKNNPKAESSNATKRGCKGQSIKGKLPDKFKKKSTRENKNSSKYDQRREVQDKSKCSKKKSNKKEGTVVEEVDSAVRLVSPNYRIDSPLKKGHDPYHFEDKRSTLQAISHRSAKLKAAVCEEKDPFGFESNSSPLSQVPPKKTIREVDQQSPQNSSGSETVSPDVPRSQTKFFKHREMERERKRLQASHPDQPAELHQNNPESKQISQTCLGDKTSKHTKANSKNSHKTEKQSKARKNVTSSKCHTELSSDLSSKLEEISKKSKMGRAKNHTEKEDNGHQKSDLNKMRDKQKTSCLTEKPKKPKDDDVYIEECSSNENVKQTSEDEAVDADVSANVLDDEDNSSASATAATAIMNFTMACQGIISEASNRDAGKGERDGENKEHSESEAESETTSTITPPERRKARIDPDTVEPKETKNKSKRKKRKNIFSETDDNLSASGKSEVSWLGSTARKKKPKPTYSYQTQGRHMGQKPKLIPNENRSEDSESDVVEIKSKSKKSRKRHETLSTSGNHNLENCDTESHSVNTTSDTHQRRKRNKGKNKVVSSKVAKDHTSPKPVGTPEQRRPRKKRKALQDIGNVTKTPGSVERHEDSIVIEVPRFEEFLHPTPYLVVDSPAVMVPKPIRPNLCEDEPLLMDDLDEEKLLEVLSQCSNFTHISSLRTPKTPATRFEDVDEQSQDSPEVGVKRRNVDPEGTGLKSGPTKRRKLQAKHIQDDQITQEDEPAVSCPTQETPKLYDVNVNISPLPSPALENSQLRPRQLFPTETPQLATPLDDVEASPDASPDAPSQCDTEYESAASECQTPPRRKSSNLDDSLNDGVTSMLHSFSSDIKRNMQAKRQQLDHLTRSTLKSSTRQIAEAWNKQQQKRQKVYSSYQATISQELGGLEKDVTCLKEAEEKVFAFFLQQMRLMQASRKSQEIRLNRLHKVEVAFNREIKNLEDQDIKNQSFVHGVLKSNINSLQKKLLQQTQQEEMSNVKRALQNLFT